MALPLVIVATGNPGKLREFRTLLHDEVAFRSLQDVAAAPQVPETGDTYAANAARKALVIAHATGCAALADDSGLEVDALAGAPGVHSARFAGAAQDSAANVAKLLAALLAVPSAARTARFRCVIALACPDGALLFACGSCEGRIAAQPRGSGGFGYDPVFYFPPAGATFAELPPEAKNRISHRARACAMLRPMLADFLLQHAAACSRCCLTSR